MKLQIMQGGTSEKIQIKSHFNQNLMSTTEQQDIVIKILSRYTFNGGLIFRVHKDSKTDHKEKIMQV